jgi:hypothetical protein
MHNQHVQAYTQLPRREIDQRDVAAMTVDDDELADAGAGDALADLDEGAERGSGESVSVPANALCSSEAPTACTGKNTAGEFAGNNVRTRAR